MVTIATFYHFAALADCAALQPLYKAEMVAHGVTGTLLVTPEGINATIAGPEDGVAAVLAFIKRDARLGDFAVKYSEAAVSPFPKCKVKLKRETIPLGVAVDPTKERGRYVKPAAWNALIANPDTIVIDTRNAYEVRIGAFKGAQNPNTRTFRDLPEWLESNLPADKDVPVAMYCTGGIRCEKSTAYLTQQGYKNVYHLEGGILQYLEDVKPEESLWEGACYVFDDRVAVDHALAPAAHMKICRTCNAVINGDGVSGGHWCGECVKG